MIKGILLSNDHPRLIEIEDDLQTYYRILNCDCIDIVHRNIGGKFFDIVCDDEALLKENPQFRAISKCRRDGLFGNLFICNHDGENLSSLSEDDIRLIENNFVDCIDNKGNERTIVIYEL